MSTVTLKWVGDLDQDKREQAGCVSSSSDQYRPKKIELKPSQKEIRIGRINTKTPPDYPIESCINQRMISRNHATVERSAKGGPILYDHSMNGTYVNYTRVMGSVTLKHGDVICFGHLNGANLKPGEKVSVFYSDLKYRVELSDVSPSKDTTTGSSVSSKKRKSNIPQATVSSTQRSDGEDEADDDWDGDRKPAKSARTSTNSAGAKPTSKPFKTPPSTSARKKVDFDEDDDELGDISDDNNDEVEADLSGDEKKSKSGSGGKKRSNGIEKQSKKSTHSSTPSSRKSLVGSGSSGGSGSATKSAHPQPHQSKRSKKTSKHAVDEDGNDMFHYDTEECGARPCKQPQDIAIDWIQCDKCSSWYHQMCVGLKPSDADVETYYCPYCR